MSSFADSSRDTSSFSQKRQITIIDILANDLKKAIIHFGKYLPLYLIDFLSILTFFGFFIWIDIEFHNRNSSRDKFKTKIDNYYEDFNIKIQRVGILGAMKPALKYIPLYLLDLFMIFTLGGLVIGGIRYTFYTRPGLKSKLNRYYYSIYERMEQTF